jgi:hypothetical protein
MGNEEREEECCGHEFVNASEGCQKGKNKSGSETRNDGEDKDTRNLMLGLGRSNNVMER